MVRRRLTHRRRLLIVQSGKGYHPFHILFARMGITVLCASVYMWYKSTEHFPFGMREVRSLLIARGLFGFFGVFGMYCKSSPLSLRCIWGLVPVCLRHRQSTEVLRRVTTLTTFISITEPGQIPCSTYPSLTLLLSPSWHLALRVGPART
jgi:hypothetical protein